MYQRCILILLAAGCLSATDVEIETKLGNITGIVSTADGVQVNVFRGIPYAKPPVGNLRLAKPQPYGSFSDQNLNATEFGAVCAQMSGFNQTGSEDCLFLNIYTPQTAANKSVMIWIHGGGFANGFSNAYPGTMLAATQDVIIVTINYRLNIFGFVTTGDDRLPGNYGLWDQRLAIQWVKDNIADYGGESSSITLFGESAGGRSVGFQLMSPQNTRDLFQRGITESGSSLSFTFINREPMTVTDTIAETLNCDAAASNIAQCLRSKTAAELLRATMTVHRPFSFFPIVDNDFLPYDLGFALANFTIDNSFASTSMSFGHFGGFDVFSGWNNQEGLLYMGYLLTANLAMTGKNLSQGVLSEVLTEALNQYPFYNYPESSQLRELVIEFYINYYMSTPEVLASGNRSIEDRRVEIYSEIAGDVVLKLPTIQHLQIHSATGGEGQTYAYEFSHRRSFESSELYEGPDWLRYGADHTDEIVYVFGEPLNPGSNYTTDEQSLSRDMMEMWANFSKTGNPGSEFHRFEYPRQQYYTELKTDGFEKKNYPLNDAQRIWSSVDASILKLDQPDVEPLNITEICLTRKETYMSGMLTLTQEEASQAMTTVCVVAVLLAIVALIAIMYAIMNSVRYSRLTKQRQVEME